MPRPEDVFPVCGGGLARLPAIAPVCNRVTGRRPHRGRDRRQDGSPQAASRRAFAAVASALVFALHPLVTEAVCEPTFREDLLVATFSIAAGLAEALLEAGRATEAEPWIRRAIAIEGRPTGDRLVTLALVLDAQGRAAEAGAAAAQAIEADPRFADPAARVTAPAMARPVANAFADLLRRSAAAGRPAGKTAPAGPRFPAKPYFEP